MYELGQSVREGDVTIVPDLTGLNAHDFEQAEELVGRGEEAARLVIERIEEDLGIRGKKRGPRAFLRKGDF